MLRRGAEGSERLLRRSRNELCRHQHDRLSGQCLQARAERQLHGNDDPERQRQPDPESLNQSWQGGLTPAHAPSKGEVVMAPSHDPHTPVPPRAGVGLKAEHYREIVETGPDIGFFEVHAENYMGAGGPPHRYLTTIRDRDRKSTRLNSSP